MRQLLKIIFFFLHFLLSNAGRHAIFITVRMYSTAQNISDENILSMISENCLEGWRHLYDRYAAVIYGVICKFTNDETLAEDIFHKVFIQLKEMDIPVTWIPSLCAHLVRHTHTVAKQQMKERGILYAKEINEETSILFILSSEHINIKEVAANFGISEEDARTKLRLELTAFHFSCLNQKQPALPYSIVSESKSTAWSFSGIPAGSM